MAYAKIRPRRGTLYEWSTYNPVLDSGELAIEYPDTGIGTGLCKIKIGNGVDKYTELPYAFDGTAAYTINGGTPSAFHVIQMRAGEGRDWYNVNPILEDGEPGYDKTLNSIKIGNGVDHWNDLEYIHSGSLINNDYDFGNEMEDDIYSNGLAGMEANIESGLDYPENVLPEGWDENVNRRRAVVSAPVDASFDMYPEDEDTADLSDLLNVEEDEDMGEITEDSIEDDETE